MIINNNKRNVYLLIITVMTVITVLFSPIFPGQAVSPTSPSSQQVCQIIMTMPNAENTDQLLSVLSTNRSEIAKNLIAMKRNMEQYEAEGYGWQNVLDSSSGLEPRPGSWLLGALRMACES